MSSERRFTELATGFPPNKDFSSWATGGGLRNRYWLQILKVLFFCRLYLEGFRSLLSSSTMSLTKLSGKTPVLKWPLNTFSMHQQNLKWRSMFKDFGNRILWTRVHKLDPLINQHKKSAECIKGFREAHRNLNLGLLTQCGWLVPIFYKSMFLWHIWTLCCGKLLW